MTVSPAEPRRRERASEARTAPAWENGLEMVPQSFDRSGAALGLFCDTKGRFCDNSAPGPPGLPASSGLENPLHRSPDLALAHRFGMQREVGLSHHSDAVSLVADHRYRRSIACIMIRSIAATSSRW